METYYFFKEDLIDLEAKMEETKNLVKKAGQETSDAAGISVDWHDNFGFEQGQRDKEMWSDEWLKLNQIRSRATIMGPTPNNGFVAMGRLVTIEYKDSGEEIRLKIGSYMVFPRDDDSSKDYQRISYISPLARLIMLGEEGQEKTGEIGEEVKTVLIKKIE